MGLVFVKMSSAVSRAILKPVFQFGMPNTDPKLPGFWCKLSSLFVVTEPQEQCFELFRMENSQKFSRALPLDTTGEGLQHSPHTPQMHNGFSPRYTHRKTRTLKKLLHTKLMSIKYFSTYLPCSVILFAQLKNWWYHYSLDLRNCQLLSCYFSLPFFRWCTNIVHNGHVLGGNVMTIIIDMIMNVWWTGWQFQRDICGNRDR